MKYLVCNFKNKLLKNDIIEYNDKINMVNKDNLKLVIAPSMPFLSYFDGENILLASQDISSFADKTITGEVTGEQLKSMGVDFVIVGHSERRENIGEINIDFINKITNAINNNMKVIYCIGESLEQRNKHQTIKVLEKQISEVLNNVEIKNIIIAYEPIWAIGSGVTPVCEDIEDTISYIKEIIFEKYECKLPVLYGGSVNHQNIVYLSKMNNVDGFLVGGSSLLWENVLKMVDVMSKNN